MIILCIFVILYQKMSMFLLDVYGIFMTSPTWLPFILSLQITIQRDSGLDVSAPKHGKIDPHNAPHVGGNQWAGGTGNSCF